MINLSNYEDFYTQEYGTWYSFESFTMVQVVSFLLYKYLLNFPLSFFVWFNNDLLYLSPYFFLPNAITVGLILKKVIKEKGVKKIDNR